MGTGQYAEHTEIGTTTQSVTAEAEMMRGVGKAEGVKEGMT